MNTSTSPPTFNLKAVVLETGIKPHTLRAWEQRYGLPQPKRTTGKQRIYTQKDIDTVKWLMSRLDEGMTISRAAELWHKLEKQDKNPLKVAVYQTNELPSTSLSVASSLAFMEEGALAEMRQTWINSCLRFDKTAAENILAQAFAIYPVKMVCHEIFQKGLSHIGDLWFHNKATIQQEHFTSALIVERLSALMVAAPAPNRIGRILVACPNYEDHTISLLLLSLLLRYRGWEVIYLGSQVPITQLKNTLEVINPNLVVLGAQRIETASYLAKTAQFLNDHGVMTAFGGSVFNLLPAINERICGHFLGESIDDAVAAVSQIMAFTPPVPKKEEVSKIHQLAAEHYRLKRQQIELDLGKAFEKIDLPIQYLHKTNSRLAQDILAALNLGDINLINAEIKLNMDLVINYNISLDWQSKYFDAYYHAARKNLPHEGLSIVEWLDQIRKFVKEKSSNNDALNGAE